MAKVKRSYNSMSLPALQGRVQNDEMVIPGKLLSLKAKKNGNQKVTEGTYESQEDVDGTGDVILVPTDNSEDSAWIDGEESEIDIIHPKDKTADKPKGTKKKPL